MSDPAPITVFRGAFRWLSNFWPSPITLGGVEYPTVEHAYQAAKTTVPQERARIRDALTPGDAKRFGRTVTLRDGWPAMRTAIMLILLRQKFADPTLAQRLLATSPRPLIESNTWGDTFWGMCGGAGENHLGRLLMRVREELRQAPRSPSDPRDAAPPTAPHPDHAPFGEA